jgi:hypothetical protein
MVNMQITPIDTMADTVEDVRRTMTREAAWTKTNRQDFNVKYAYHGYMLLIKI